MQPGGITVACQRGLRRIPPHAGIPATIIPILQLYGPKGFNIAGSFNRSVARAHGARLPFAFFLLRTFMGEPQRGVFQSAAIDGANPVTAFSPLAADVTAAVPITVLLGLRRSVVRGIVGGLVEG